MSFTIEKAKEENRQDIFRLLRQANMHYIPSEEMPSLTYKNYFVAKANGKVVGFSGYKTLSEHNAKTELMVVDNQTRGQGIGYALQMRRMEDMLNKGIRELITNADLPSSIHWYKKHFGYKEIRKLKKIHEFGDPNIDEWTTLQVDLLQWDEERKRRK